MKRNEKLPVEGGQAADPPRGLAAGEAGGPQSTLRQGGTETRVNTSLQAQQTDPRVWPLADGGWLVTWQTEIWGGADEGADNSGVFAQRYSPTGAPVGGQFRLNVEPGRYSNVDIVSLPDGGFLASFDVWVNTPTPDNPNSAYPVVATQRFTAGGAATGPEFRLSANTSLSSAAGLSDGGVVVVGIQYGTPAVVVTQRFDADGDPMGDPTSYVPAGGVQGLYTTGLADGGWLVVRYGGGGSSLDIYMQRFSADGIPVGVDTRVNTFTTADQWIPQVITLTDGGWVIAWQSEATFGVNVWQDGDGPGVYMQRYDASGAAVGPETRANTWTADYQESVALVALPDGGWVVTWESHQGFDGAYGAAQDGAGSGIYAQRYGADGQPIGVETRINASTNSDQSEPSVAVLGNGDLVFVWRSLHGGPNDLDIYQTVMPISYSSPGDDRVFGGKAADVLNGLGGDDVIYQNGLTAAAEATVTLRLNVTSGILNGVAGQFRIEIGGEVIGVFQVQPIQARAPNWSSDQIFEIQIAANLRFDDFRIYHLNDTPGSGDLQRDLWFNSITLNGMTLGGGASTYTPDGGSPGVFSQGLWQGGYAVIDTRAYAATITPDNDTVDGGSGVDTVVYFGASTDFHWALGQDGVLTLTDLRSGAPEGSDRLSHVEFLRFSNGLFDIHGARIPEPLIGTNGADVLVGTEYADQMNGGAGDDILTGGAGNDVINGGQGYDVARFSGDRSDYRLVYTPDGRLIVKGGADGGDQLIDVEEIQFGDGRRIELLLQYGPEGRDGFDDEAPAGDDPLVQPVEGHDDDDFLAPDGPDLVPGPGAKVPDVGPWVLPGVDGEDISGHRVRLPWEHPSEEPARHPLDLVFVEYPRPDDWTL